MGNLEGRAAVVTGASRGLGRAIALELAQRGARVVVNYRQNEGAAREVVETIRGTGREAIAVQADVSRYEEAERLIRAALEAFGRVDILVNNAGATRDNLLAMMKEEDWDFILMTNLKSAFNCAKAALRPMMRQRYGRIINVSSVAGLVGNPGQTNYAAAKAGLIGFTKSLAKEVGSRNITVNAVAPGLIPTDMTDPLPQEIKEAALRMTPLGRLGTPEDVAYAVAFLASDEAAFITGHVLTVDGGMTCV